MDFRPYISRPQYLYKCLARYHKTLYLSDPSAAKSIYSHGSCSFDLDHNSPSRQDLPTDKDGTIPILLDVTNEASLRNTLCSHNLFTEHGQMFGDGHYALRHAQIITANGSIVRGDSSIKGTYICGSLLPLLYNQIRTHQIKPRLGPVLSIGFTDHSISEILASMGLTSCVEVLQFLQDLKVKELQTLNLDISPRDMDRYAMSGIEIRPIPLGYDPNTVSSLKDYMLMNSAELLHGPKRKRCLVSLKCDMTHRIDTIRYINALKQCFADKADAHIYMPENRLSHIEYLEQLSRSTHCLCIPGQGLDTYRFWECLALGVTPIAPAQAVHAGLESRCLIYNCYTELRVILQQLNGRGGIQPNMLSLAVIPKQDISIGKN